MKRILKSAISCLLMFVMVFQLAAGALAYMVNDDEGNAIDTRKDLVITDQEGNTVTVDETWDEKYPYGMFVMSNSELSAAEGGDELVLTVHRLGGTKGKASAIIQYMPVVYRNNDGSLNFTSALSPDDIELSVEKPLQITRYQAFGLPEAAEKSDTAINSEEGVDGEGESCTILWPDIEEEADKYEWYALYDGDWMLVDSSDTGRFPVSESDIAQFDFRCVYTTGGTRYCTTSLGGVEYEKPEPEVVPEMPEDVLLNEEPQYQTLALDGGSSIYDGLLFELCFAENELQKEIHIKINDDDIAEPDEFATITMIGSVGGEVMKSMNTLLLRAEASDTDKDESAQIGFAEESESFDKSGGTARITLKRTGSLVKTLSAEWQTVEGTAKPGEDYVESSGTVYFYSGQSEATIEIELINNLIEQTEETSFTVTLSELKGDEGDGSMISAAESTVSLFNSNTATELNLASELRNVDAIDVSGQLEETEGAAVSSGEITAVQVTDDDSLDSLSAGSECTIDWERAGLAPQLWEYNYGYPINFGNDFGDSTITRSLSIKGDGTQSPTYKTTSVDKIGQLYTGFYTSFAAHASFRSWTKAIYGDDEIATTRFKFDASGRNIQTWTYDPQLHKDGIHMVYYPDGWITASRDWNYGDYGASSGKFSLGLVTMGNHDVGGKDSMSVSSDITIYKRTINGNFYLQCFTANDENLKNTEITKYSEENYQDLISDISVTGGIKGGKLYEGSTVKINLSSPNLVCYGAGIYDGETLVSSGTLSNNGKTVTFSSIILNPDWSKNYSFRLALRREQNIAINITTSTDPKDQASESVKYQKALDLMLSRMNNKSITIGYSADSAYSSTSSASGDVTEVTKNIASGGANSEGVKLLSFADVTNIQWINFNLPEEDLIVVNGKAYPGNAKIWLRRANLAQKTLSFFYYEKDFLTTVRPMVAYLDVAAVYYDEDGNGMIDGYYDSVEGVFVIDPDSDDRLVAYVEGDYDETRFRPTLDREGKLHQYFIRQYYSANPVALVLPEGASDADKMQVMPNFITGITSEEAYSKLTPQQQAYRTIVSGKTSIKREGVEPTAVDYSADNHIKYGAEASEYTYVDMPLGGDAAPCHQMTNTELRSTTTNGKVTVDGQEYMISDGLVYYYDGTMKSGMGAALYKWDADFRGNLLNDFEAPEVVYIEHNELGDNVPVTNETETLYKLTDGSWTKTPPAEETKTNYATTAPLGLYVTEKRATAAGIKDLNEYLGSFTGNDTFALSVAEQSKTTDELMTLDGLSLLEEEEEKTTTVAIGFVGVFPNSEYMLNGSGNSTPGEGGSEGQGEMDELNLDMGSDLTAFSAEGLAIFGVETDGLEVTLSIGIPLYGKDNGEGTGSSASNTFDDISDTGKKIKDFYNAVKNKSGKDARNNALAPEEFKDENVNTKSIEFSVGLSLAITLKYNPMDNSYKFNKLAIILTIGFEIRLQHRFSFCPLLYAYFQFGVEVTIQSGFTRDRVATYEDVTFDPPTPVVLSADNANAKRQIWFSTDRKGFGVKFTGKLYVECYEYTDKNDNNKYDPGTDTIGAALTGFKPGYITSNGESVTDVMLLQKDGMDLGKDAVVVLSYMNPRSADGTEMTEEQRAALPTDKKQTTVSNVYRITGIDDEYYWNGFSFNIEVGLEVGVGVGIEIVKAEIYLHGGIEFGFTLGVYNSEEHKYEPAQVDSFGLSVGIGIRAVFLFFSYEMELAEYHLNYNADDDEDGQDVVSNSGWSHGWSAFGGNLGGDDKPLSVQSGEDTSIIHIKSPSQVKSEVYRRDVFAMADEADTLAYDIPGKEFQVSGYGSSVSAFKLFDGVETGSDYQIVTVGNYNYLVFTVKRTGTESTVDNTMLALSKIIETQDAENNTLYGLANPIAGKGTDTTNWYLPIKDDGTGDLDFTAWAEGDDIHVTWVNYKTVTDAPVVPTNGEYNEAQGSFRSGANVDTGFTYNGSKITEQQFIDGSVTLKVVPEATQPVQIEYYTNTDPNDATNYTSVIVGDDTTWWFSNTYANLDFAIKAFDDANAAYAIYYVYSEALASFNAWKQYYIASNAEEQLYAASKNTEVNTATFDTKDTTATGFTDITALSSGGSYKFVPISANGLTAYAQSVPYTDSQIKTLCTEYGQFMMDAADYGDKNLDEDSYTYKHMAAERDYRVAMQKAIYRLYGGNSTLTIAGSDGSAFKDGTVYVSRHQKDGDGTLADKTNEILVSIDLTKIGDAYYVAYVTQQDTLVKNDADTKYTDQRTIQRLYLRSFTIEANAVAGEPTQKLVWGDPYLLRTVVNYENSADNDGVYDSTLSNKTAYKDPYISKPTFLNGVLGDKLVGTNEEFQPFDAATKEEFLIFEMNGNTYVIKQESITDITTTGSGAIIPFFTYEQLYGDALMNGGGGENLSSGKNEVIIGTDGGGNVAAVYTATVPNTSNNALYIAYWDSDASKWGSGKIIAMNYLQVYEDSVAENWDDETTTDAYFDTAKGGGMTQFRFSNIAVALGRGPSDNLGGQSLSTQGAEANEPTSESVYGEYLDRLGISLDENGELEGLSSYSASELYALREQLELMGADVGTLDSSTPELLVITQGSMIELEKRAVGSSTEDYIVTAKMNDDDNTAAPANVGVYAISYGKGSQQVGNVSLRFAYNEFTAMSQLHATLSFINVGDAAIRGSAANPVTVELCLNQRGVSKKMATWTVAQNIGSGQTVNLSTDSVPCKALSDNLIEGDYFYLTVTEDESYVGENAYKYNSADESNAKGCGMKYVIENKPELGIEKFNASVAGVNGDGKAIVDVSFDVTNRGSEKAEEVFVQFSYVSGYDGDGDEIYTPLNLTGSELYVSQQKYITGEFGTLGTDDLANGIIYLGTDVKFYTSDYYISSDEYNAMLAKYYSLTPKTGLTAGVYNGTTYYYDQRIYISAYAAYVAGQTALSVWTAAGDGTHYYNSSYSSFAAAQSAADAKRRMEYILTEDQYNNLSAGEQVGWKRANEFYIPSGYADYAAADEAFEAAKRDSTQDIEKSYCRTVKGTFLADPALFNGKLTGSLDIRAEVFSDASITGRDGNLYTSAHEDEYYSANNEVMAQLEQKTYITAANRITMPANSEYRLPINILTTTGKAPEISVNEVSDENDEIGALYYEADANKDGVAGTETGYVYIMGLRTGTGVIHIKDLATNTTYPVAYTVQAAGDGINIFNDNSMFTFYNADGSLFNPDETGQDWEFSTFTQWPDGTKKPYLDNLAVAKPGAYFTFKTKASEVNLSLKNNAMIVSDSFYYGEWVYGSENNDYTDEVGMDFNNTTSITHTVTVYAGDADYTYFDTLLLKYDEEYKPSDDVNSPGLYFSRSFPNAGTIVKGTPVTFKVYAVDDSGISSLRFNGKAAEPVKKTDAGLWEYEFEITENGSYTIIAEDMNSNSTARTITADWFVDENPHTPKTVPELTATIKKYYKDNAKPAEDLFAENAKVTFTSNDATANNSVAYDASSTDAGAVLSYYKFDGEAGQFKDEANVSGNGYYMVKAADATEGTFRQQIFFVDCFEEMPEVSATLTKDTKTWIWSASKEEKSTATLKSVTLNGIELDSGLATQSKNNASGSVELLYGGEYFFIATDTKDIAGSYPMDIEVPVTPAADMVSVAQAWGQPDDQGAKYGVITLDFANVTGGDYANDRTVTSLSDYYGSYEYAVIKTADAKGSLPGDGSESPSYGWLDALSWKQSSDNSSVVTAEANDETEYTIIIRDKQNPQSYDTMAVLKTTVKDNGIDVVSLTAGIASGETVADGDIYVVAEKGETGYYEFAVLPVTEGITADDFKADGVEWQRANWSEGIPGYGELNGLAPGEYQIAVRAFYNGGTEKDAIEELFALGTKIDDAENALSALIKQRANDIEAMKTDINDASLAWRIASEDTAAKLAKYNELNAKNTAPGANPSAEDIQAANEAYDAYDAALTAEATARTEYLAALTGANDAKKQEIENLRKAWLDLGTGDGANAAYDAYSAAIAELCEGYQNAQFASDISDAEQAITEAQSDYDAKNSALGTASINQYKSDAQKWDGMLTGTDTRVTVRHGMATSFKAIPMDAWTTGSIDVTAMGGSAYDGGDTIHYQYAVKWLNKGDEIDYTGKMQDIGQLQLDWQFADDVAEKPNEILFDELLPGDYMVFVRQVYDPDIRDGDDINENIYKSGAANDLYSLRAAYEAAEIAARPNRVSALAKSAMKLFDAYAADLTEESKNAFLAAVGNNAGVAAKLLAWENAADADKYAARTALSTAVSDYMNTLKQTEMDNAYQTYLQKLTVIKEMADKAYQEKPGYYENVSYAVVTVGIQDASAIISTKRSEGKTCFTLQTGMQPTLDDVTLILNENKENEVVLVRDGVRIVIPAGKLQGSAEILTIFDRFAAGSGDAGNAVKFTAADGSTCIVPSVVQDGKAAFLYIGNGRYAVTESGASYKDIADHWAKEYIEFTSALSLFNGVGDGMFLPEGEINRAMAVTVLYRMVGSPAVSGKTPFTDVADGMWYSDAVLWAYQNNVVNGVSETEFAPEENMTREQFVTVMYRFLNSYGLAAPETDSLTGFSDEGDIEQYARDSFAWAVGAKIVDGIGGGLIAPKQLATRAQMATVFARLVRYILG